MKPKPEPSQPRKIEEVLMRSLEILAVTMLAGSVYLWVHK